MEHKHQHVCQASGAYDSYIAANLEYLKAKCSKLTNCIDRLVEGENPLHILSGQGVSLNRTCGLIYKTVNGSYTSLFGQCPETEREEIRSELETHIDLQLRGNKTWGSLKRCLANTASADGMSNLEQICLKARNKTEFCSGFSHTAVEKFLNTEMRDTQCVCQELFKSDELPTAVIAGIGVGCFVAVIAIFLAVFFVCTHKLNRKKTGNRVTYTHGPDAQVCIKGLNATSPVDNTLSVSTRYNPRLMPREDVTVMTWMKYRPVPPIPDQTSTPDLECPPRYSQCELDAADDPYFEPIPEPTGEALDKEYPRRLSLTSSQSLQYVDPISSLRTEAEPSTPDMSFRPVPAKRSKITEKKMESQYFEIESEPTLDNISETELTINKELELEVVRAFDAEKTTDELKTPRE
nr:hypothetical protein BgiMline_004429 [Biomphalaria glabrata]